MGSIRQAREGGLLLRITPVAADLATAAALMLLAPVLSVRLADPSGWNALLLVVLYIGFCLGVYLIRKLEPQGEDARWLPPPLLLDRKVRIGLAAVFGLLMVFTVAYQFGYLQSLQSVRAATLGEGDSSSLFVYAPGAWLGFSMLYILVLAFPVNVNVPAFSNRYAQWDILGLILTSGMFILAVSQAKALEGQMQTAGGLGRSVGLFVALLVSFGPPRVLYQQRQPGLAGWISLGLLLFFATWLLFP